MQRRSLSDKLSLGGDFIPKFSKLDFIVKAEWGKDGLETNVKKAGVRVGSWTHFKVEHLSCLGCEKCWRYLFPNFSMLRPRNSMLGCLNCLYFLINLNAWGSWLSVLSSFFVRLLQYSRYMSSRVWRSSTKSKCLAPYTLAVHPVVWK